MKYKYHPFGSRIFEVLAKNSFFHFAQTYKYKIFSICVDDNTKKGYSHSAILNKYLKTNYITPLYKTLLSQSGVRYASQSLEFRLNNPRDFKYTGAKNIDVILVDDIVTTGTTLKEAKEVLARHGVNVAFCMSLVDKRY